MKDSPAKQEADYPLMCNIMDVNGLADICRRYNIDAVIGPYLDVSQRPYYMLCNDMSFHCFGNQFQHEILTDKKTFKNFCISHGADVVDSYTEEEIINCSDKIEWPVLIKPSDSRGSRGQTICFSHNEAVKGIEFAESESSSGEIVIEKYMGFENDIQLVYFIIEGEPVLYKIEDRYTGAGIAGLETLCTATITPSVHEESFMKSANGKIISMLKALNLKNAPVFIQAFMDGEKARLYDPGLRMPGDDYDAGFKSAYGIDIAEMLVKFSLTGKFENPERLNAHHHNKFIAMILPCLKPGIIHTIRGLHKIESNPEIVSSAVFYHEGDHVNVHNNVKQRFGEFVLVCDDAVSLRKCITWIYETLNVTDDSGENMLIEGFDTLNLNKYHGGNKE